MKHNEIKDPIQEFLDKNNIKNYEIHPDGLIDVTGNVYMITKQSKFPVKFGRVIGNFICDSCELTSLEGAPSYVGGSNFSCNFNQLTSLEGAPSYVGGYFSCSYNQLTSLHNVHKIIKEVNGRLYFRNNPITSSVLGLLMIKGIKGITLDNIKVTKILNKYLGRGRAGIFDAQQEFFDSGLDEYARL